RRADNAPRGINISLGSAHHIPARRYIAPPPGRRISPKLLDRGLGALDVVHDQRDFGPSVLRSQYVDGLHVDSRAGEAPRDLRKFSWPVQKLEVKDVAQLVLQARIRQGLLRRLHV